MHTVLSDGAGGFQRRHDAQLALTNMRADTLQTAAGEIDLHGFAHLQQHPLNIDLMAGTQARLGQFHDHQRVSTLIVFNRALSDLHGGLNGRI
ncbi:hypothetical protein TOC8172_47740 [Pseudomonas syringae]